MSNSSDYIITTLSSSIKQRTFKNGAVVAPFGIGIPGVQNLRGACQPYSSFPGGSNVDFVRSDCVSAGGGGGGGIPASITAKENLQHWWKLNEGSDTSATDYGLSAEAGVTDLTLSGVTTDEAGPSAIGTPAAISFDGVNDSADVKTVDSGGSHTSVGSLINAGSFSMSVWINDDASGYSPVAILWQAVGNGLGDLTTNGFGTWFSSTTAAWWLESWSGRRVYEGGSLPTSGWENWIVTFPDPADGSGEMKVYYDGTEVATYAAGSVGATTALGTTADSRFSFGCGMAANGTTARHTAPILSDIRLYNKTLSTGEVSNIAAGDWT